MASSYRPTFTTFIRSTIFRIDAEQDGSYKCPCSLHVNKPNNQLDWLGINSHMANWFNVQAHRDKKARIPVNEITKDLVDTPLLRHLGLVMNQTVKVMVCTQCQHIVPKLSCVSHMQLQHCLSISAVEEEEILFMFHQLALYDELPQPSKKSFPASIPVSSGKKFFGGISHRQPSPKKNLQETIFDPLTPLNASNNAQNLGCSLEAQALNTLRILVGNQKATWSCNDQRRGILAALALEQHIIAILKTGSGKTMLAIIPALLEKNKVTVVILPFRSLMEDYRRKLEEMKVPFEVFEGKHIQGDANLLLVSADITKADSWRQEASILNQRKPIVRQIFDEAHIPLMSADYRPALRDMFTLHFIPTGVQLILLSATVLPHLVPTLVEEFGLSPNPLILRTTSNRPELQYIWREASSTETVVAAAVHIIKQFQWSHNDERGLVFVPFCSMGQDLASRLGCKFYSGGDTTTDEQRQEMARHWRRGDYRIMVCTSAFGTGNDYSHTRLVIHAGTPFEMVSYVQEVSRAGRDGILSTCVLLPHSARIPDTFPHPDYGGKEVMCTSLHSTKGCIRHKVTAACDEVGTACGDSKDNALCDFCQQKRKRGNSSASLNGFDVSKKQCVSTELNEQSYIKLLRARLNKGSGLCAVCRVAVGGSEEHQLNQCATLKVLDPRGVRGYYEWRKTLRYPKGAKVCYTCHVPQGPKDCLHSTFTAKKNDCKYRDIIAPSAYAIFCSRHKCAAEKHFETAWNDIAAFSNWINAGTKPGEFSRLSTVFMWLCDHLAL